MSVCGRKWHDIVCKNDYVGMSVKEIYNEWYETLRNEEMFIMSGMKHYVMKKWIVNLYLEE